MSKTHSFHIPVMGIGFTIDTPLKVSQYGIDSVLSLVDDILLEKLRKFYCNKFEIPYQEISDKIDDFRAKRITSYLNMVNDLAEQKFDELKTSAIEKGQGFKDYMSLLPDSSNIKKEFNNLTAKYFNVNEIKTWLNNNLSMGSIDVNIMTKIDKDNYKNGEKLPAEFKDAHAALRGFAESKLESTIILSAGMNPGLYNYLEKFEDFYPDNNGYIKKKIALKVSDYRSALIQGKYFAKKGIWVSEYRIESGLNCGGHAFATEGFLMGPILAEFRDQRQDLIKSIHETLVQGFNLKNRKLPEAELSIKITAQGGVGTTGEHQFLMDHYKVDSVGWGTPFLLVPEATTVDNTTFELLLKSKEEDLYLSAISPLGVPFNSIRGNTKDVEKYKLVDDGKPGSLCPKKYLVSSTEYTDKAICTASFRFQRLKIKELKALELPTIEYKKRFDKIVEKACICVGLGTSALLKNNLNTDAEGEGISVCPGPNMAYFSNKLSMKEMVDHIYGRTNILSSSYRPNMFMKELRMYIDHLKDKIDNTDAQITKRNWKKLSDFASNLKDGINYYDNLFIGFKERLDETKDNFLTELEESKEMLQHLNSRINKLTLVPIKA